MDMAKPNRRTICSLDGLGQKSQDKMATGKITRFESGDRFVWTTGDASVAYQSGQKEPGRVQRVTRDLVFVGLTLRRAARYRNVENARPNFRGCCTRRESDLGGAKNTAVIRGENGTLTAQLVAHGNRVARRVTDKFPVPVDPKYVSGEVGASYVTGKWSDQSHLTATSAAAAPKFTVFAVLWPERGKDNAVKISAT